MTGLGASVISTQAVISLRSYLNPQGPTQQTILNFTSADGVTAAAGDVLTLSVPANTTGYEINLPVLFSAFTAPIFVSIADITNPGLGFLWYTTSGAGSGTKQSVGANNWLAWMANGSTALVPIYVDNTSSTSQLVLSVGVMTQ